MEREQLEELVRIVTRRVLDRLLTSEREGTAEVPSRSHETLNILNKRLISEQDVLSAVSSDTKQLRVSPGTIVTPLAADALKERGITLATALPDTMDTVVRGTLGVMVVQGTVAFEQVLSRAIEKTGYRCNTVQGSGNDPDRTLTTLSQKMVRGELDGAVVIDDKAFCRTITANRIPGVRATMVWDIESSHLARSGCKSNILLVSPILTPYERIPEIVQAWLSSSR
jgi:ribose 5-phosphate isomerase RpiB